MHVKILMATCSFVSLAHVTSLWGSSSRDPQNVQCITLNECNKNVSTHLKKLNVGPDTINDEKTLLLARADAIIIHYCSGLSLLTFVCFFFCFFFFFNGLTIYID